jgi:hypothetical protein
MIVPPKLGSFDGTLAGRVAMAMAIVLVLFASSQSSYH